LVPEIELVHFIPGRFRLKSEGFKGKDSIVESILSVSHKIPVIENIEYNSITGSILITYDYTRRSEIINLMWQARLFGYMPSDINTNLLTDVLCGEISPEQLLSDNRLVTTLTTLVIKDLCVVENKTDYIREMTTPALYYTGMRSLLLSTISPVTFWVDYIWVGFSTLTALNSIKRPGVSLSNLKS